MVYQVYCAGPIFFEGDLYRCQIWKQKLEEAFGDRLDTYFPVLNTEINGIEGKKKFAGRGRLDRYFCSVDCFDPVCRCAGSGAEWD